MNKGEFEHKLILFCEFLEEEVADGFLQRGLSIDPPRFVYDIGYKYARVSRVSSIDYLGKHTQRSAVFRVDVNTGDIYGCKSWTQVNTRRWFGDLDKFREWSWRFAPGATPRPGTVSEVLLADREREIRENYKVRGRKSP